MMLDWLDPSLVKADPLNVNWNEHYWPKAEILNLTPDTPDIPKPEEHPPKLKLDKDKKFGGMYRASSTIKYKCVMYTRSNYRDFPFDNQTLEISCKLSSIRIPPRNAGTRPVACNPSRWRKDDGHQLIPEAGKYFKREESVHRVYGSTVVDISFPLSHFQTYFIVFFTYLLYSKTPQKSVFLTQ